MPRLSLQQQAKKEEYEKGQKADTIYRIMTNKPKPPKSSKSSKSSKEENRLNNLSIEDCDFICKNEMVKRMMARTLGIEIDKLTERCENTEKLKEYIDSTLRTIRERERAKKSPIKDLPHELLFNALSSKALSIVDLHDDAMRKIAEKYKLLLKYELREWIIKSLPKLLQFISLNPNAIDFLSLRKNKKYIIWSQLSQNINSKALELLKAEIMVNPNNSRIDWFALSRNPDAIEILDANRDKIEWPDFSGNTSPKAIQIIEENQADIASRGYRRDANTYWYTISANKSTAAIKFISSPENYHNIFWDFLSTNTNPKAIEMLINKYEEENKLEEPEFNLLKTNEKVSWKNLSRNPEAISLLEIKWEDEKVLTRYTEEKDKRGKFKRFDMKQYNQLKKKGYIIDWVGVSLNPKAIDLLRRKIEEENNLSEEEYASLEEIEKIKWWVLSANPGAIELLEDELKRNPQSPNINWSELAENQKAIKLLEEELKRNPQSPNINWNSLSKNPKAIHILDANRDKIVWSVFSENPEAGELLKHRVEFEGKLLKFSKKEYDAISEYNKLKWDSLAMNPSIFTLA